MNRQELLAAMLQTLDDRRLSRSERAALDAVLADLALSEAERKALRAELFGAIRTRLLDRRDRELVDWLHDVVKVLDPQERRTLPTSRALFGPEDPMVETLVGLIRSAKTSLVAAVFTITDDRVAAALIDAHKRDVAVRILTDDEKSWDRGSDIERLRRAGLDVHADHSDHHFHHKFAVFDDGPLLCGSYNWTRSADAHNRENFLITHEPVLIDQYKRAFDRMWAEIV